MMGDGTLNSYLHQVGGLEDRDVGCHDDHKGQSGYASWALIYQYKASRPLMALFMTAMGFKATATEITWCPRNY